jgi:hypothetical protein
MVEDKVKVEDKAKSEIKTEIKIEDFFIRNSLSPFNEIDFGSSRGSHATAPKGRSGTTEPVY